MTRGPDGSWRSLDTGSLGSRRLLIGAHYRDELARCLRDLGSALQKTMVGPVPDFGIVGWTKETLGAFSTHRQEIVDHIDEKGWNYNAATAQAAALKTRKRKKEPHREVLTGMWRECAGELGIDLTRRRLKRSTPPPAPVGPVRPAGMSMRPPGTPGHSSARPVATRITRPASFGVGDWRVCTARSIWVC